MSRRTEKLWDEGRPTLLLRGILRDLGATQPLLATVPYLDKDGRARDIFLGYWAKALPTRDPLPFEPLADKDGRGTQRFWDVLD